MPEHSPLDYCRYFPVAPEVATWGICVTAAGFTKVPPHSAYPPSQDHPADHNLSWERGRVLDALQIILIINGEGKFETKITSQVRIKSPAAFVLMPGVWHRYAPLRATGWEESWLEVRGPLVDRLVREEVFSRDDPVRHGVIESGMDHTLDVAHRLCRNGTSAQHLQRTAAAFGVLTSWKLAGEHRPTLDRLTSTLDEAEIYLASNYTKEIDLEQLARRLGIAYSYLRSSFRARTGLTLWKYVLHLRLERSRRLLAGTDAKLEAIATELGFSSPFHFSDAFKKSFGISPHLWREQLRKKHPADRR